MRLSLKDGLRIFRFGLAGLPGFVCAIGLNILLIEVFQWPKPVAYLLVVWMQMTVGFAMCRWVVFTEDLNRGILAAYGQFALSMAVIRVLDWLFYTLLV